MHDLQKKYLIILERGNCLKKFSNFEKIVKQGLNYYSNKEP
jgi:hypothetical protein